MNYINAVTASSSVITEPIKNTLSALVDFVPVLLASLLVLVIGLILAPLIGNTVRRLLELARVDSIMDMSGAKDALANVGVRFTLSRVIGEITKYVVLIIVITVCADILGLTQLSAMINQVIAYIPHVVVALVIVGIGLTAAEWLQGIVVDIAKASKNEDYAQILGNITRIGVVVFAVMAALLEMGIARELIMIMFAGAIFAFALAFGLGAKDIVGRALEGWVGKR